MLRSCTSRIGVSLQTINALLRRVPYRSSTHIQYIFRSDVSPIVVLFHTIYISFRRITNCSAIVYNIYFVQTYHQLQSYCLQYIFRSDASSFVVLLSTIYISLRRSINLLQSYYLQCIFRSDVSPIVVLLHAIKYFAQTNHQLQFYCLQYIFRLDVLPIVVLLYTINCFVQVYLLL